MEQKKKTILIIGSVLAAVGFCVLSVGLTAWLIYEHYFVTPINNVLEGL